MAKQRSIDLAEIFPYAVRLAGTKAARGPNSKAAMQMVDAAIADLEFDEMDVLTTMQMKIDAEKSPQHWRRNVQCPACGGYTALYHTGTGEWGCTRCNVNGEPGMYWVSIQRMKGKK